MLTAKRRWDDHNLGLILGIGLMFEPMAVRFGDWKRDFTLALIVPVLTLSRALDGSLSRVDGLVLVGLLCLWMVLVTLLIARGGTIGRRRGLVLLTTHALFIVMTAAVGSAM